MAHNILMMDNRQLIPRWHTSRKLFRFNYPTKNIVRNEGLFEEDFWFKKSVELWKAERSIPNAIDVFVRFIQADERNHPLYLEINRILLDNYETLPNSVKHLVCPELRMLDNYNSYSTDAGKVRLIIQKLKKLVHFNPRDSLSWMDLGFYYSILGEMNKAMHCVDVAKNIDPNHAFIARSYARFLVHIGDPEQASWYLKNRPNLNSNPLIMSAYTAISSAFEIRNPSIKKAVSLIDNWGGDNAMVSELAACVGTIEFNNGSIKKAKKHIQVALTDPSENVISHVHWLHHKHNITFKNMPHPSESIEGGVNDLYQKKKFEECRGKLIDMHQFQPYSAGPIVDAGYLSIAALDDPNFVIQLSDKRIPHSHMRFGELNNLIVAKLLLKQTKNLDVDLRLLAKRVDVEDTNCSATFKATIGMAFMESGMIVEGKKQYDESIEMLARKGLYRSLCLAKHFYAKQVERYDKDKAQQLKLDAIRLAKKHNVLEVC
ncbi:hypothetical protein [uncultured Pseudoalteromonas sp.]|uniref:tetratricopeptide repeat protein n=1 Tax=uncultured Pseudoalteromonas sp. TaxID=114053 RepID=UPI0032B28EE1